MVKALQRPVLNIILFFVGFFIVLSIILGAYEAKWFDIDLIVEPTLKPSLITLTKLEPNMTSISVTQNEKASKLISVKFSDNIRFKSSIHGFDKLDNDKGKKVISLLHDDTFLANLHFINLDVNPSNNQNLTVGTYEGYVQITYNNSKEIKSEWTKVELKINQAKKANSSFVTP